MNSRHRLLIGVAASFSLAAGATVRADVYHENFMDEDGGGWAFVTGVLGTTPPGNTGWANADSTRANPDNRQGFIGNTAAIVGPEDGTYPNGMGYLLLKFNLSQFATNGGHATSDATVTFDMYWNHYNNGTSTASGYTDGPIGTPGALKLFALPSGKVANSAVPGNGTSATPWTDPATFSYGFQNASFNSVTSNGTDESWLTNPTNQLASWDGVTHTGDVDANNPNPDGRSLIAFTIPEATINGWIDNPSTYNGLMLEATPALEQKFQNAGIVNALFATGFGFTKGGGYLTFNDSVPEPTAISIFALGSLLALRRRRA